MTKKTAISLFFLYDCKGALHKNLSSGLKLLTRRNHSVLFSINNAKAVNSRTKRQVSLTKLSAIVRTIKRVHFSILQLKH